MRSTERTNVKRFFFSTRVPSNPRKGPPNDPQPGALNQVRVWIALHFVEYQLLDGLDLALRDWLRIVSKTHNPDHRRHLYNIEPPLPHADKNKQVTGKERKLNQLAPILPF